MSHAFSLRLPVMGLVVAMLLAGCQSNPPMPTVDHVDLDRYMGDWYVIANIPTFLERDAHNAVETYTMNDDGTIDTVFRFRRGGFDGDVRRYNPRGFVRSENNAEWGMRFVWPFKAEFLVIWLDDDYRHTVIGRTRRDYVWIMSREPEIPAEEFEEIVAYLDGVGYDVSALQRVPQRWPEPDGTPNAAATRE